MNGDVFNGSQNTPENHKVIKGRNKAHCKKDEEKYSPDFS